MAQHVAAVLVAALRAAGRAAPANVAAALEGVARLRSTNASPPCSRRESDARILLGALAERTRHSPNCVAGCSAGDVTGARLGYVPEGANAVGASLAGATPHRGVRWPAAARPGCRPLR